MASFLPALAGGVLIGAAALLLLLFNGRIAGISGIVAGLVAPNATQVGWRAAFVIGLLGGGLAASLLAPASFGPPLVRSQALWLVGGLLVGVGARMSGGCTSGHGVCGLGRLSPRSIVATTTFMATGAITVFVLRLSGALS